MLDKFGFPTVNEMLYGKKQKSKRKKLSRAVEKSIYTKHKGRCAICNTKAEFDYGEVDHIKPLAKGGSPTAPSNLQWLCSRCNKLKGSKRTNAEVKKLLGVKPKQSPTKKSPKKKTTRKKKSKSPFDIDFDFKI